jgi:hypothetical protein
VRRPERTPRWWKLRFQDPTPIVDVRALESAALILGHEVAGGCLQFESLAWMEGKKRPWMSGAMLATSNPHSSHWTEDFCSAMTPPRWLAILTQIER